MTILEQLQRADQVIAEAAMTQTRPGCIIYQYDDVLLFHPILPEIAEALTITEKALELNKRTWLRETTRKKRELFARVARQGGEVGSTYQGFLNKIINTCITSGKTFKLCDMRTSQQSRGFPAPRLDLMHGFRFSQEELLKSFLLKDRSGLLGAPTRYGKTTLMINTLRAFPTLNTVVTAPGVDLCNQLYDDLTGPRGIKNREIKKICSGSRTKFQAEGNGITICSADSLEKCDTGLTELLLADEPHAYATGTRVGKLNAFTKARRYGYGATLKGRFDGRDPIIEGLFGPVLVERTYKEAVAEGAICPLNIIFMVIELTPNHYRSRDDAYKALFFNNQQMAGLTARICNEVIPQEYQTMLFIKNSVQADIYRDAIGRDTTIAMAKQMNTKQRAEVTELMRTNVIKRCLCTDIYVQGVTFSDARVLINCEAGGNNTTAIQKPGRLAEIRPNKKCGIIIDFMFTFSGKRKDYQGEAFWALVSDSKARKTAYEEKGYGIYEAHTIQECKTIFNSLI